MRDVTDAFFVPDGDRYVATEHTRGPWSSKHQHGGPPTALIAHVVERTTPGFTIARVSVDFLRPVPIDRLGVRVETLRAGSKVQRLIGTLLHGDTPLAHATVTVVRPAPVDIHMAPDQRAKQEWLRGLADLEPDLVVNTGDNLSHRLSVPVVRDSLGPLLDVPGVFVFGSNDYFSPTLRNPVKYLLPDDGKRYTDTPILPWRDLRAEFLDRGLNEWQKRSGTAAAQANGRPMTASR